MMVSRCELNDDAAAVPIVPCGVVTGIVAPVCAWVLDCRKSALNTLRKRPRNSPVVNCAICSVVSRLCGVGAAAFKRIGGENRGLLL